MAWCYKFKLRYVLANAGPMFVVTWRTPVVVPIRSSPYENWIITYKRIRIQPLKNSTKPEYTRPGVTLFGVRVAIRATNRPSSKQTTTSWTFVWPIRLNKNPQRSAPAAIPNPDGKAYKPVVVESVVYIPVI